MEPAVLLSQGALPPQLVDVGIQAHDPSGNQEAGDAGWEFSLAADGSLDDLGDGIFGEDNQGSHIRILVLQADHIVS